MSKILNKQYDDILSVTITVMCASSCYNYHPSCTSKIQRSPKTVWLVKGYKTGMWFSMQIRRDIDTLDDCG